MVIFIEGASQKDSRNSSSLQEGFIYLINQLISSTKAKKPSIKLCGNQNLTLKLFNNAIEKELKAICLIDLDGLINSKEYLYTFKNIKSIDQEKIFFMVIEMESWFLSQPEILNEKYRAGVGSTHFQTNFRTLIDPKGFIKKKVSELSRKQGYNEVVQGGQLLQKLKIDQLCTDFPDVARLREFLTT